MSLLMFIYYYYYYYYYYSEEYTSKTFKKEIISQFIKYLNILYLYKYKYKNIHVFPQMEDLSDLGQLNKKNHIQPQTTCSHTHTHEWQILDITAKLQFQMAYP